MNNKVFLVTLGLLILGVVSFFAFLPNQPEASLPGTELADNGRKHVAQNAKQYGDGEPPASGEHAEPLKWNIYDQEVPDINIIHNLEHGGVYVSYRPDLPADQIAKIKNLFGAPFSRKGFSPSKVIVAPRSADDAPIIMTSWNRQQKFEKFDEQAMYEYYFQNVGKSPEAGAS